MGEATTDPVRLPPGPRIPKAVMGIAFLTARHRAVAAIGKRYGSTFTVNLPIFGETVVISDPVLIKDLFTTSSDLIGRASNLGTVLGPGSTFSLDGDEHRARRKLLVPPFHGKRMAGYEAIVEEEVMREIRDLARGPGVRNAAADDAHHAQRHPAHGVRGAGQRVRRTAATVSADGAAGIPDGGDACGPPARPRPVESVGTGAAVSQALQRDHRRRSSPKHGPTRRSRSAPTCSPSCCRHVTKTARRSPTTTSPTNCSRCSRQATRRRRRHWLGRSNGSAGTRACCPG